MVAKFDCGGPDSYLVNLMMGSWQEAIGRPVIEKVDSPNIQLKACASNLFFSEIKVNKPNLLFSLSSLPPAEDVRDQSTK